jgi:hypothetical protein
MYLCDMLYVFTIDLMICKLHRFAFYALGFDTGIGLEPSCTASERDSESSMRACFATAIEVQEVNQAFSKL